MTCSQPQDRPSAEKSLELLRAAARRPWGIAFRWRLRSRTEHALDTFLGDTYCIFREVYFQLRHLFLRKNELSFGRPR